MKFVVAAAMSAACALSSVAGAAGVTLTVTHELDAARPAAHVAVPFAEIAAIDPTLRMYHVIVRDPKGRALPMQITNYEHDHRGAQYDDLVFTYDFAKGQKRVQFTVEPVEKATPPDAQCAYARLVPERLDDVAWENDRIAHRAYGIALNSPAAGLERLRGSGIDVWGKRVTYPVIDRWYPKGHDQFHKDGEGEGLDLYSIGGSRGAGGTGVWDGTKLWTSDNYERGVILSNGPRRAAFKLWYAPYSAGKNASAAQITQFTVDCGDNFDAIDTTFDLSTDTGTIGIGIAEHMPVAGFPAAVLTKDPEGRWMSYWEDNQDGGLGVAVILAPGESPAGFAHQDPDKQPGTGDNLLLVKARDNVPLHYFAGAGWTGSGQFADRAAWEKYVRERAAQIAKPFNVTVSAHP
jgi:hypothetical protein